MLEAANFDLWERTDVADNAEAIVKRLEDGSMPCAERPRARSAPSVAG